MGELGECLSVHHGLVWISGVPSLPSECEEEEEEEEENSKKQEARSEKEDKRII